MIMTAMEPSKSNNESRYQFLSKEKVVKLQSSGCKEEEIRIHNEIAKSEMDTFLKNNSLLNCSKINDTFPELIFVLGFEKEGKSSVIRLLEHTQFEPYADCVSSFNLKKIKSSLSSELDKDRKTEISKLLSENDAKVVLVVLSCAIHRGEEYLSPVLQNLTDLQIGKEENQRRCLLVLTHAKSGLRGQSLNEHFEEKLREGGCIANLYRMAYPHIIAIEATDGSPYGMKRQQEQLLSHLSRVLNLLQVSNTDGLLRKFVAYMHSTSIYQWTRRIGGTQ